MGCDGLPPQGCNGRVLREPSMQALGCPGVMRALAVLSVVLPGSIK